ncbi:MAG: beta-phosphoglucomutase [Spirochaetes bacterium]|nr:MAG: beta-phosphoglucomutase [Spirochaetota bacterium]
MLALIIFDLDGVIVSTDRFHYEAWKKLSDDNGLEFNEEVNQLLRGVSRSESLKIILEKNNRIIEAPEFNAMLEKKNRIYRDKLQDLTEADILPGVITLLEDINKNNLLTAVGSSSKNTPLILKRIGLDKSFDTVVDGNSIRKSKPDPEVFIKCAQQLKTNPGDCVVYEDAAAGIEAALAAGMVAIGVGENELPGAHRMAKTLKSESCSKIITTYTRVLGRGPA